MNKNWQWERDLAIKKLEEAWKSKPVDSATANWKVSEAKIPQTKVMPISSLQKEFDRPVKKESLRGGIRQVHKP